MKISYNKVFGAIFFTLGSQIQAMIEPARLYNNINNHSGSTIEESRSDFKGDNRQVNI